MDNLNSPKQENIVLKNLERLEKSTDEVTASFQKIVSKLDCILVSESPKCCDKADQKIEELSLVNSKIESLISQMNNFIDYQNETYRRIQI